MRISDWSPDVCSSDLQVLAALAAHTGGIKGLAHITGGGLLDNVPRILQPGLAASLHRDAWPMPQLFLWMQQQGGVADTRSEGRRVGQASDSTCRSRWVPQLEKQKDHKTNHRRT